MPAQLIAVVGSTGTGKSELAIRIAETFRQDGQEAEIVNADAMQLYKGMDIGTAKLPITERRGIEHHLVDVLEVKQESTAAEYQKIARAKILEIQSRGAMPILVGGSMLYVAAVLNNFEFPVRDKDLRASLEQELLELGPNAMHQKLVELDASAASRIDPENGRRIVRALEIVTLTGEPFAAALPDEIESWQEVLEIGLRMDREILVAKLAERVRGMWSRGMVEETKQLVSKGLRESVTAGYAIGYAQALAQLDGELSQEQAIESTTKLTQKYARRQMSWFKRDTRINWLDALDPEVTNLANALVRSHGLLASRP
ncbi:MAG: tRNA (adenosine(37)-N6)-dimethylallyltransferase MiaA [Actinobacteria bacterium]|uniref:tRNA dimethylallyltransferase n=1 Tax=freshwater metagenome TaxID=449393 RepID=A0A6J7CNX8_9ZZZZ|nr:tRNA (adenosine(37)-N6)-dimethylallyltransferase MiaA [Actinomycetota bacterium]MSZ17049.1 tRNA (adenosine(37)-N6)-dimethylallyltransferase MiaA [Actinomycetota bacterium]